MTCAYSMGRLFPLLTAVMVCVGSCGCAGRYLSNRCDDFADVFEGSVGVCMYGRGLLAPHFLVSAQVTRAGHLAVGKAVVARAGLYGGELSGWTESGSALPAAPFCYRSRDAVAAAAPPDERYWQHDLLNRWDWFLGIPSYFRDVWSSEVINAEIGAVMQSPLHWFDVSVEVAPLLPVVRLGFSPGEFFDFAAGLFGWDPAEDDWWAEDRVQARLQTFLEMAKNGGRLARRRALLVAHRYRRHRVALEIFEAACHWPDVRERGVAFTLFTRGNWPYEDAVIIMIRLLSDPDPRMRRAAMGELGGMAECAGPSLPVLMAILDGKDRPDERGMAASLMADIVPHVSREKKDSIVRALGRHLDDPAVAVAWTCRHVLESLRNDAVAAIPDLIRALSSASSDQRCHAIELLGKMGPRATPALPALRSLRNDPSLWVRRAAERAVKRIERR